MMDQELKEYISLSIGSLTMEVSRLSGVVEKQNSLIREIEIRGITGVAELKKDIVDIREEIKEVKAEQRSVDDSQKFKWKTLSEERTAERKEKAEKDADQAVINEGMKMINKLLWLILGIVCSIGIGFVWSLIVSGGVKGLVP